MEPNWVLSASNGPHVGSMNLAIRVFETIYDHIHCDDNKSHFLLSTVLANILASFGTKCQDICGYGLFMNHAVKIKLCKNANTWLLCTRQLAHCAVGGCISLETWGQYQYMVAMFCAKLHKDSLIKKVSILRSFRVYAQPVRDGVLQCSVTPSLIGLAHAQNDPWVWRTEILCDFSLEIGVGTCNVTWWIFHAGIILKPNNLPQQSINC